MNALRAFEAAARLESFTDAADELCVTPSAISRQIKKLENHLSMEVFERQNRKIVLKPDARSYALLVRELFQRLQVGTNQITDRRQDAPLHIVCPITFGSRWLIPRIPDFLASAPNMQIRMTAASSLVGDPATYPDADLSIEFSKGPIPDFESHTLLRSKLVPVCSPQMAKRVRNPGDLEKMPLLHSSRRRAAWAKWATGRGLENFDTSRGMEFNSLALAYHAAAQGIGVAMGDVDLIGPELRSGALTAVCGSAIATGDYYYLMYPKGAAKDLRIARFVRWILAEVRGDDGRVAV